MNSKPWKIRAVQLDLARQMENLDYIKGFIDFIAEYGYNALLLYLEGRVKTKSFPYPSEQESYSPDEMLEIVSYAGTKGIDVIPAIQAIGHAELFLKHPELAHLWELRDTGGYGRWKGKSNMPDTFCPSLPETKEFLENYIEDLVEIFPSQYFHAGLDEAWHMGVCDLCRKHPGNQDGVFGDTVLWLHDLLTGKHGKRMMVWDDMYERYPRALDKTPRDVIMCCWHYNTVIESTKQHFSTCRENFPEKYGSMGFDTLISPCEWTFNNIITFTDYAMPGKPIGGLVTTWEKSLSFMPEAYPVVAYAGRAWKNPARNGEDLARSCIAELFGIKDEAFADAVLASRNLRIPDPSTTMTAYLRGTLSATELNNSQLLKNLRNTLAGFSGKTAGETAENVLDDMITRLDSNLLFYKLRKFVPACYGRNSKTDRHVLKELAGNAGTMAAKRFGQWARFRKGIDNSGLKSYWITLQNNIEKLGSKTKEGLLTIRCFHPWVQQDSHIQLKYQDETDWITVAEKRLCPVDGGCFYRIDFPVAPDKIPVAVRFSTWGYGFQGVSFISVENDMGVFVPESVSDSWGAVENPLNALVDDDNYFLAGTPSARESYSDLPGIINHIEHGLEIRLRQAGAWQPVTRFSVNA